MIRGESSRVDEAIDDDDDDDDDDDNWVLLVEVNRAARHRSKSVDKKDLLLLDLSAERRVC